LYEEGPIKVPDHHPYGSLTVEGILQKSSNIGAYKLARQLGMDRFYQYVSRFGFGKKTGIQFFRSSFLGNGFCTIFTILSKALSFVIRVGPCATGTSEPVLLI